ncbi:54S ribosomal protein L17, mitochondrial [Golovinomyces cichoracearum]|uniref:Large ribosomal subunit protein mL46 n=1 Tax=Golovinomyces cichoracearum TaxID=62708 RepID=A0A420IZI3_9PEZI|nr:54S ribosomal protein L17, mitochondrial [Golovinomyces cichoracearum]
MTASCKGLKALMSALRSLAKIEKYRTGRPPTRLQCGFVFCSNHCSRQIPFCYSGVTSYSVLSNHSPSSGAIHDELISPQTSPIKVPRMSSKTHDIHTGIILSRPPLLTPNLHSFEKAFFFYQKRLNERLAIPFIRYFYFKKDTPSNTDWKIKFAQRGSVPAKELGTYNAYGIDSWNDELLVNEKEMIEPEYIIDQLVKDAKLSVTEDGVVVQDEAARAEGVERPRSRVTDADLKMDLHRLDRALDRTLYLVVRNKETDTWSFPTGEVLEKENLNSAAQRVLDQSCGIDMNTWLVGHVPIAHYIHSSPDLTVENQQVATKGIAIFFMKGRIMAGQADLSKNKFNLDDYRWLTKNEIEQLLPSALFKSVSNSLHER